MPDQDQASLVEAGARIRDALRANDDVEATLPVRIDDLSVMPEFAGRSLDALKAQREEIEAVEAVLREEDAAHTSPDGTPLTLAQRVQAICDEWTHAAMVNDEIVGVTINSLREEIEGLKVERDAVMESVAVAYERHNDKRPDPTLTVERAVALVGHIADAVFAERERAEQAEDRAQAAESQLNALRQGPVSGEVKAAVERASGLAGRLDAAFSHISTDRKMIWADQAQEDARAIRLLLLSAIPTGGEGEGWRPIESAPKDGRDILLYGVHRLDGERLFVGGWWPAEDDWSDEDGRLIKFEPTHWMPLPQHPQKDTDDAVR